MDNFKDVKAANAEARAAARKEAARIEAKQRRQRATAKRAAINTGAPVAGRHWGEHFKGTPARSYSFVRTRSLVAGRAGANAAHAYAHNLRQMPTNPDHIDPSLSHQNYIAHQATTPGGAPLLPGDVLNEYRARGLLSERSKAEGVELLFALSPAIWEAAKPEARPALVRAFGDEVKAFMSAGRFRYGRLLQVVAHADEPEAAPNVKAVFLPLMPAHIRGKKGQGPQVWKRQELDPASGAPLFNEDGTPKMGRVMEVTKAPFKLNTKQGLSDLQTEFANHLRARGWHVQRGEVHEPENHQKHKTSKEWRSEQERAALGFQRAAIEEGRAIAESIVNDAEQAAHAQAARIIEEAKAAAAAEVARMLEAATASADAAERRALQYLQDARMTADEARAAMAKRQKARDDLERYKQEREQPKDSPAGFVSRERAERERRAQARDEASQQIAQGLQNPSKREPKRRPSGSLDI